MSNKTSFEIACAKCERYEVCKYSEILDTAQKAVDDLTFHMPGDGDGTVSPVKSISWINHPVLECVYFRPISKQRTFSYVEKEFPKEYAEYISELLPRHEGKWVPPSVEERDDSILAVDFDGTLCEKKWPEIGEPILPMLAYIKKRKRHGARLILWTNRVGERLEEAVAWCAARGVTFDAINENLPDIIKEYGSDCRKIYADEYIDDKAFNATNLTAELRNE